MNVTEISVTFRSFRKGDYSEFKKMCMALYREDPVDETITEKKISRTIRELQRNRSKGRIIIFEEEDVIVGYSILIFYWSNEFGGNVLHIDELYVKSKYRQRGFATMFFQHLLQEFKDEIVGLKLEVTPSNTKAMAYYRKLGFKKTRNIHLTRVG
jgi:ribosomal protein S18 acetylase RimI-like enzyme